MILLQIFFSTLAVALFIAATVARKYSLVVFAIVLNIVAMSYVWVAVVEHNHVISTALSSTTAIYQIDDIYGKIHIIDLGGAYVIKDFHYLSFTTKVVFTSMHLVAILILVILAYHIPMAEHEQPIRKIGWSMGGDEL